MDIIFRGLTAQCRHDVFGETFALPDGVLRIRHGVASGCIDAEICDGGIISSTPGIRHGRRTRPDTEVREPAESREYRTETVWKS